MAKQLNSYIDNEKFSNVNQSAYRRLHSTETALLKIQKNIAASMDPVYTIDHDILFNCLRDWFVVDGTVVRWIKSYLSNLKQKVKLGNSFFRCLLTPLWSAPGLCPGSPPFYPLHYPSQ